MKRFNPITFCISTYNNLPYLKLAVKSVRENSFFREAPFIVHAENCKDGTDEWLKGNHKKYDLEYYIDKNDTPIGIGGGMNFCADKVETDYIMFLHSDFVVTKDWDFELYKCALKFEDQENYDYWISSYRIEPRIFNGQTSRPGTWVVDHSAFGWNVDDFDYDNFQTWAEEFKGINDIQIPKGEGVSGLIRKDSWDKIGGNDPLFAPASWEDMDLFLRMLNGGYKFLLTSKSLVWHFGARGSHRIEEIGGKSSKRQIESERKNRQNWLRKWKSFPKFDDYGMICGLN